MANSSDTGCGTLLAVAAIAFFVGRFSVGDKEPSAPTTQQFMSAPAADETFAPTPVPIYTPPQRVAEPSAYYRNCSAARAAGAAPVRDGDPGYAPHLDRDGDGVGCE
jgi:Excalibur calcium-binding domain